MVKRYSLFYYADCLGVICKHHWDLEVFVEDGDHLRTEWILM